MKLYNSLRRGCTTNIRAVGGLVNGWDASTSLSRTKEVVRVDWTDSRGNSKVQDCDLVPIPSTRGMYKVGIYPISGP